MSKHNFIFKFSNSIYSLTINNQSRKLLNDTIREIHFNVNSNKHVNKTGGVAITQKKPPAIFSGATKTKKDEGEHKKLELKEWTERIPAWISREPDEGELVKHIQVLQRFADRYNEAYGPADQDQKKPDITGNNDKKLLKILDKQPVKKFSTFVGEKKGQKKKAVSSENDRVVFKRAFITLEKEPGLSPIEDDRSVSTPPKRKPDSIKPPILTLNSSGRKLHLVVNPIYKKKQPTPLLKKSFVSGRKEEIKKPKVENITAVDYYGDRYVPKTRRDFKLKSPAVKRNDDLNKWSSKLKETLVQNRKSSSSPLVNKLKMEPAIHPKTSLLVKPTDLPLQLCKNMKSSGKSKTASGTLTKGRNPEETASVSDKLNQPTNTKSDTSLMKRVMKYFKF